MIIIVYLLLVFALFYANYYKSHRSLHMLQQNLYNENNRYVKWIFKNILEFINLNIIVIGISIVGVFVIYDLLNVSLISMGIMIVLLLIDGFIAKLYIYKYERTF